MQRRPRTLAGLELGFNERQQQAYRVQRQQDQLDQHHSPNPPPNQRSNPSDWNGMELSGRSDQWPHNNSHATEYTDRFYSQAEWQTQTPKPVAKPSQRGGTGRDMPGYAGHRQGARSLTDAEIADNIYAFGARGPSPSQRERPTVVGTRAMPTTPTTPVGTRQRPATYLALASPPLTVAEGSASSLRRQQQQMPWEVEMTNEMTQGDHLMAAKLKRQQQQRRASPFDPPPLAAPDVTIFEEAMLEGARPSFEVATPVHESYRHVVGGIKAGYSGHVPARQYHIGSAAIGGSVTAGDFRVPASQRGHSGTRMQRERVPPVRQLSYKAADSAVGYRGVLPGEQDSLGGSYWAGWAAEPEPAAGRTVADFDQYTA